MRMQREFKAVVNLKKIRRIMKKHNLVTEVRRKNPYKNIFKAGANHIVAPNILNQDFITLNADEIYSTDITYLYYGKNQVAYLSAVEDLGTSEIVHYKVFNRINTELATAGLEDLLKSISKEKRENLIIHSDQGVYYTANAYRNLLKKYNVTQSMSRRGNCLDNAPIESFFGHFKDEVNLKCCQSFKEVVSTVVSYMNYYNNDRPQWSLKGKTPAECRGSLKALFY